MPGKPVSLATIAGAPTRTVTLAGKDYHVGTLRPRDVADLQAFVMRAEPDPRKRIRELIEGLPSDLAIHIWDRETAQAPPWPPTLDTPQGRAALVSPDGMAEAVFCILRWTVAGLTREQAREIADELSMAEFNALLDATSPESTPGDGEDDDPKATTVPRTTAPS